MALDVVFVVLVRVEVVTFAVVVATVVVGFLEVVVDVN